MKLSELSTGQILLIGCVIGAALHRAAQLFAPWHLGTCHGCGSTFVCDSGRCPRFYPSLGVKRCHECGNDRRVFVRPIDQRVACWVCLRMPDPETGLHKLDAVCPEQGPNGLRCERIAGHNGEHAIWIDGRVKHVWLLQAGMDNLSIPRAAHGQEICGDREVLGFCCEAASGHAESLHVFSWDDSDTAVVWRSGEQSRMLTRANSFPQ